MNTPDHRDDSCQKGRGLLRRRTVLAWLAGSALLAACSAPASPAPTAPGATATSATPSGGASPSAAATAAAPTVASGQLKPVKYGLTSVQFEHGIQYIAEQKGFWNEFGVDVEMTFLESDATLLTSLLANEFDVAYATVESLAPAVAKGGSVKIVGMPQPGLQYGFLAGPRVDRLEDLVGKSFAISRPGALPDAVIQSLLKEANIDPGSVEMVGVGGTSARVQAVAAGKVDATVAGIEAIYRILEDAPDLKLLFATQERIPRFMRGIVAASGQTLEQRPEVIAPVLAGEFKAIQYALSNREEMIRIGGEITQAEPGDRPILEKAYDFYVQWNLWNPSGKFDTEAINYMQQQAVALGQLEQPLPIERIATTQYNDEAIRLLNR